MPSYQSFYVHLHCLIYPAYIPNFPSYLPPNQKYLNVRIHPTYSHTDSITKHTHLLPPLLPFLSAFFPFPLFLTAHEFQRREEQNISPNTPIYSARSIPRQVKETETLPKHTHIHWPRRLLRRRNKLRVFCSKALHIHFSSLRWTIDKCAQIDRKR